MVSSIDFRDGCMYDQSLRSLPLLESTKKPHPRSATGGSSPRHRRFSFSWKPHTATQTMGLSIENAL
ncbi:hypothetical protein GQ44DRAFT_698527 [Phaeosphaeriaceae sp. PMI808]|nr:hypothetical protein GQ44DRAFT_698527 [Phaeosphaeriaceae sp. PMI808]